MVEFDIALNRSENVSVTSYVVIYCDEYLNIITSTGRNMTTNFYMLSGRPAVFPLYATRKGFPLLSYGSISRKSDFSNIFILSQALLPELPQSGNDVSCHGRGLVTCQGEDPESHPLSDPADCLTGLWQLIYQPRHGDIL